MRACISATLIVVKWLGDKVMKYSPPLPSSKTSNILQVWVAFYSVFRLVQKNDPCQVICHFVLGILCTGTPAHDLLGELVESKGICDTVVDIVEVEAWELMYIILTVAFTTGAYRVSTIADWVVFIAFPAS